MDFEIKNSLYSLLDFLDAISNIKLFNPEKKDINLIRDEILGLINKQNDENIKIDLNEKEVSLIKDKIQFINNILSDKDKIKDKKELVAFSNNLLPELKNLNLANKNIDDIKNQVIISLITMDVKNQEKIFKTLAYNVIDSNSSMDICKDSEASIKKNQRKKSAKSNISKSKSKKNTYINEWLDNLEVNKE